MTANTETVPTNQRRSTQSVDYHRDASVFSQGLRRMRRRTRPDDSRGETSRNIGESVLCGLNINGGPSWNRPAKTVEGPSSRRSQSWRNCSMRREACRLGRARPSEPFRSSDPARCSSAQATSASSVWSGGGRASPAASHDGTGTAAHRTGGRTTPSATTCRRASATEPPPAGTITMS